MSADMILIPWCETCQSNHHSPRVKPCKAPEPSTVEKEGYRDVTGAKGTSDLVARRVIVRRDRWDAVVRLTDRLYKERGISATPAEIAAIVIDAGLETIAANDAALAARIKKGKP